RTLNRVDPGQLDPSCRTWIIDSSLAHSDPCVPRPRYPQRCPRRHANLWSSAVRSRTLAQRTGSPCHAVRGCAFRRVTGWAIGGPSEDAESAPGHAPFSRPRSAACVAVLHALRRALASPSAPGGHRRAHVRGRIPHCAVERLESPLLRDAPEQGHSKLLRVDTRILDSGGHLHSAGRLPAVSPPDAANALEGVAHAANAGSMARQQSLLPSGAAGPAD